MWLALPCIDVTAFKVIICDLRHERWLRPFKTERALHSFLPYLPLPPSCSSGKQHITLSDSSNHSTVFARQVQNVTDTQLIGWGGVRRGREGRESKKLNRKQNPPCITAPSFPPSPIANPPSPLLLLHPFPSSFHSCHSFFRQIRFDSTSPRGPPNGR